MANLKEELLKKKLNPVKGPVKDFSNPKLAGFMKKSDIEDYQNKVLDVNTEHWLDILREFTFPTTYCPISVNEASLFVKVYERLYQNLDHNSIAKVQWEDSLSETENDILKEMKIKLQNVLDCYVNNGLSCAFVKTSSRSPKDGPLGQARFEQLYKDKLMEYSTDDRLKENIKITALLQASFDALQVKRADEVLDMFFRSERIYQDMLLALAVPERFHENYVIRKFIPIDVDMEFRGFVFNTELVAVSQYNYLIYSPRLIDKTEAIRTKLTNFFETEIKLRLTSQDFPQNYIVDFAISDYGESNEKLWVIEINPYLETTDGALFSWQHERPLLEGSEGFQFRLTNRPKPGAKAMLPTRARELLSTEI